MQAPSSETPPTPGAIDLPPVPSTTPADARFQLAAYRDGDLKLHVLGDTMFVSGGGGLAQLDARGDRMVPVEYALSGQADPGRLFDAWLTIGFGGRWPDNAWLTTQTQFSRSGSPPLLHRREGNFWKRQDTKKGLLQRTYASVITWHSGQVLGLRVYQVDPAVYEDTEELSKAMQRKIAAAQAASRPGFDLLGEQPTPAPMVIASGLVPVVGAAAPSGELFLLAHKVGEDTSPRVQRWGLTGEAAVAGKVDNLAKGMACELLVVGAADEAYVACNRGEDPAGAYLARFDGATWSEEPGLKARHIDDLTIAPEGALYAVIQAAETDDWKRELWRRSARGTAWEPIELPELRFPDRNVPEWAFDPNSEKFGVLPADPEAAAQTWKPHPLQVRVRAGGDVWVVASTEMERANVAGMQPARHVVLRASKVSEPLRMLPDGDLMLELLDWGAAPAWTPKGCGEQGYPRPGFVPLRTLPRDAPRNAPEPLVEAFVRDNAALMPQVERVVEVFRRGRRTVGFYVRPTDQAGADALLAALTLVAPGEKRTIECREPRIRREFDRTTGQALQAPAL